jgi:Flp pilus assembly protein TadD
MISVALSGCAATHQDGFMTASLDESTSLPVSSDLVRRGQRQFTDGNYGSANGDFAKSTETDALNADAWLGLAASYDQIGRFDEANRAYAKVQELIGSTSSVLNNMGYSYLLRGKLDKSQATLEAAYRLEPANPFILNNIDILNKRLAELGQPQLVVD